LPTKVFGYLANVKWPAIAKSLPVVLGLLAVTGCAGSHHTKAAQTPAPSAQPTTRLTGPPAGTPFATSSPSASTTTPASTPPPPTGPQNLTVTPAVRQQLIAAYESAHQLGAGGVKDTRPGSVYYALDPSTGVHWAVANFDPGSTLSLQQSVGFQDGGSIGAFREAPHANWQLLGAGGAPADCTHYIPLNVRTIWDWPSGASCGSL
jgi:hypothetical protein